MFFPLCISVFIERKISTKKKFINLKSKQQLTHHKETKNVRNRKYLIFFERFLGNIVQLFHFVRIDFGQILRQSPYLYDAQAITACQKARSLHVKAYCVYGMIGGFYCLTKVSARLHEIIY